MLKKVDIFGEMFEKAIAEIDKQWTEGTFEYLEENHPGLLRQIDYALDQIDKVWVEGKITSENFKKTLITWYRLIVQGAKLRRGF